MRPNSTNSIGATALASALLLGSATTHGASLIQNGSFELGNSLSAGTVAESNGGKPVDSWSLSNTVNFVRAREEVVYGAYPRLASDGEYYLGINWSPGLGVLSNSLWQSFVLPESSIGFDLSFDMSSEFGSYWRDLGYTAPQYGFESLTVEIRDQSNTTVLLASGPFRNVVANEKATNGRSTTRPLWDSKIWSADLQPGTYVLRFNSVTNAMAYDVLLDNVVLNARSPGVEPPPALVPLPGTLGLLGMGLVGLGLRRRSTEIRATGSSGG